MDDLDRFLLILILFCLGIITTRSTYKIKKQEQKIDNLYHIIKKAHTKEFNAYPIITPPPCGDSTKVISL